MPPASLLLSDGVTVISIVEVWPQRVTWSPISEQLSRIFMTHTCRVQHVACACALIPHLLDGSSRIDPIQRKYCFGCVSLRSETVMMASCGLQVVQASAQGFPVLPEAALTADWCGVRVNAMAVVQRPDPRAQLHVLRSDAVAVGQALSGNDSFRGAVQTALTMYLHQRAYRNPLAVCTNKTRTRA